MPQKIAMTLNVQVTDGPKLSETRTVEVQAFDTIEVNVPAAAGANAGHVEVQVQPGAAAQVQFLVIRLLKSDHYTNGQLSYKVNAAENDVAKRTRLDSIQVLSGTGAVGLLGAAPNTLHLYNLLAEESAVQILVGRDATP